MVQETFICIYCKKTVPEVKPTVSHVIPDFLGGALELKNAVCKDCNNRINREIEEPMKKPFAYLRSGLDLGGRRRKEIKIPATTKILGKEIEINIRSEIEIPPFEYQKSTSEKGLVIVGDKNYVEKEKQKINSKSKKTWKWEELEGSPNPKIFIEVLPFNILVDNKGQRLAAKIAFERLCQIRTPSLLVAGCYDEIREFILTGNSSRIFSNLFFNFKVMNQNFNIPFPWHALFLMQRGYKLLSIVTLLGLFYFLVILTTRSPIFANWEECILSNPQSKEEIVPILRGSLFPKIPDSAFRIGNDTYKKAAEYATDKFNKALRSSECMIITNKGIPEKAMSV